MMPVLRRHIDIVSRPGIVRGVVQDDFHDFRVEVAHAEGFVRSVMGSAVRHPWTLCAMAAQQIVALEGVGLSTRASRVAEHTDRFAQCTHVLDLAGLCIAAAARGTHRRRYEIAVPARIEGRTTATLLRDRSYALSWNVDGSMIRSPADHVGIDMRSGFAEWTAQLADDDAEAASALRRAIFISGGLGKPFDTRIHANPTGGCFVLQPQRAEMALRVIGSTLDLRDHAGDLNLAHADWLAFRDAG